MRSFPDTNQHQIRLIHSGPVLRSKARSNPLRILEQRLSDGYTRIEQAMAMGEDVTAWEDFWIELLHQYEAAVDRLPEAA